MDGPTFSMVDWKTTGGISTLYTSDMFYTTSTSAKSTSTQGYCPSGARIHAGRNQLTTGAAVNAYYAGDSTVDNSACTFGVPASLSIPKGGFAFNSPTISRSFPSPDSSVSIAIDAVFDHLSAGVFVVGRLAGPTFNFKKLSDPDAGVVTGSGFFMARFEKSALDVQSVTVFGGTPIEPVSLRDADHRHASISVDSLSGPRVLVAPFENSIDFGTGPLSAPSNGHAIGLARLNSTFGVIGAVAFPKGPASKGKLSRPAVTRVSSSSSVFIIADTFWDTVDVGGIQLTAKQGADVFVAAYDFASGKGLWGRVYGGPGDDFVYSISGSGSGDFVLAGHSETSIDLGNGPLVAPTSAGETWIARLPQ